MSIRRILLAACLATVRLIVLSSPPLASGSEEAGENSATVRVAGIVLKWVRGDKEANYRRIEPLIREAAAGKARIVITTESFLDGYAAADKSIPLDKHRALAEPIPDGEYFQRLSALAAELRVELVVGLLERDGDKCYNTAAIIGPEGSLVGKYHKQELGHELDRNTPGDLSSVFDTALGPTGVMICADRTKPQLVQKFCDGGAGFLLCPSGGMFGPERNDPIVQARSRETGRHIVFVHPAEFLVTGPDGEVLSRTILGDRLLVTPDEIGTKLDEKQVFYYDLPLPAER